MAADMLNHLTSLHTHAIDARNGYEEALDDADGKGLTGLFRDMIALHTKNADELAVEITKRGESASDDGSFMTTIHRTIMSIRSLFNGLGDSVLPGLIDGEERNVSSYRETLERSDVPADVRVLLQTQCERLESAIQTMKQIETHAGPRVG
jgi:uncharacterized protein (TIGR02284 family)